MTIYALSHILAVPVATTGTENYRLAGCDSETAEGTEMGRNKVVNLHQSRDNRNPRPSDTHGDFLSVSEMNSEIQLVLGEVPLKAYEKDRHIILDDGVNEPAGADDLTAIELIELLYDWAVFAGYTNEDFEDFLEAIE